MALDTILSLFYHYFQRRDFLEFLFERVISIRQSIIKFPRNWKKTILVHSGSNDEDRNLKVLDIQTSRFEGVKRTTPRFKNTRIYCLGGDKCTVHAWKKLGFLFRRSELVFIKFKGTWWFLVGFVFLICSKRKERNRYCLALFNC